MKGSKSSQGGHAIFGNRTTCIASRSDCTSVATACFYARLALCTLLRLWSRHEVYRIPIYHKRIVARPSPSINDAEITRSRDPRRTSSIRLCGSYEWSAWFNHSRVQVSCAHSLPIREGKGVYITVCQAHPVRRYSFTFPCVRSLNQEKNREAICPLNPVTAYSPL